MPATPRTMAAYWMALNGYAYEEIAKKCGLSFADAERIVAEVQYRKPASGEAHAR